MQNEMYSSEPNLIAENYRKQVNLQIPRRIERHFDFLEFSDGGCVLLGTSNLSGRIWCGSVWVFKECPLVPDMENCLAGLEFESSVASGLWLENNRKVVIGCDSGGLHWLSLNSVVSKENNKDYLTTDSIVTEHDDSIVSLALMKNKDKIVSGSMDMNIKVWDAGSYISEKSYCPAHGHIVTSVSAEVESTDIFASTSHDGLSLLWDTRLEKPASLLLQNECGYTTSAWVDEKCILIGSNDGSISIVDLRARSEIDRIICSKRPIFKLNYNKELELLAVCADDPIIRVFNCKDKTLKNIYVSHEHKDFVRGLAWEPSSQTLYSCGWDSKILSHQVTADVKNEPNST